MKYKYIIFAFTCVTSVGLASLSVPKIFENVPYPDNNIPTISKRELGRKLFYDTLLSKDNSISCASCHHQNKAFTDGTAVSVGVFGRRGKRSSPSLINVAHRSKLFWHGGSQSLELQALGPLTDHNELALSTDELVSRLNKNPEYKAYFQKVFRRAPDVTGVVQALATFQRSLNSYNSPFDLYQRGDEQALSPSQIRGMDIFYDKAECFHCHNGNNFSDNRAHNNASEIFNEDIGLAQLTQKDEDVGKFITPTLRNIALTAPYMHAGSMHTLREVVEHYNNGGQPNPNSDELVRPLGLNDQEVTDLVNFLTSLTDATIATNPDFGPPQD